MRSDRRALIVGVQEYTILPKLDYSRNDAELIAEQLSDYNCQFSCQVLLNDNAKAKNIRDAFKFFFQGADEDAILIFFFAGHGVNLDDATFLITLDAEDDFENGIHFGRLIELVNRLRKSEQTVIFFLDCCHAGAMPVELVSITLAPATEAVGLSTGVVLFAATESEAKAFETEKKQQGIFTDFLFHGLSGAAANSSGEVTASSLHDYMSKAMSQYQEKQRLVYKTTVIGKSPVLATGYTPQQNISISKLSQADLEEIHTTIRSRISAIRRARDYTDDLWVSKYHLESSKMLTALIEWMSELDRRHKELHDDSTWKGYEKDIMQLQALMADIKIGMSIDGGTIVKEIGHGGFGTVYTADTPSGLRAYKVYHGTQIYDRQKVKAFQRGYRAMRELNHPNIVRVYTDTKAPIGFFMDYISGLNFRDWWHNDLPVIMNLLHIIAQTLEHAHSRDVVHRDIKPENIIVDNTVSEQPIPYLTDFDLAWYSMATFFSTRGDVSAFGHYLYAAPEQYETPGTSITRKPTTDIYGFGQLCYFAICGQDPARDSYMSIEALRNRVQTWQTSVEAPRIFVDMYAKCISRKPSARYQSMTEVSSELLKVRNIILDPDRAKEISSQQFINELIFSIYGLERPATSTFTSRSGRTEVNLQVVTPSRVEIYFNVLHEYTGLTGTYDQQRRDMSRRVDTAIDEVKLLCNREIFRHNDRSARMYGVKLDFPGAYLNLEGVEICRQAIFKIIDAMEAS